MNELQDTAELFNQAEWACFHRRINILKDLIESIEIMGLQIPFDTPLLNRLTFFGYERMNKVDDLDLLASLNTLEQLREKYSSKCTSPETSDVHFLRVRIMTIRQMCMLKLYEQLGLSVKELPPSDPRLIRLPATFNLDKFSDDVDELFQSNKLYTNSSLLGKIELESISNTKKNLLNLFEMNENGKLLKESVKFTLHYILHEFSFQRFTDEIIKFSRLVEMQGLPPPQISGQGIASLVNMTNSTSTTPVAQRSNAGAFSSSSKSPVPSSRSSKKVEAQPIISSPYRQAEKDWTEEQRDTQGPYASNQRKGRKSNNTSNVSTSNRQLVSKESGGSSSSNAKQQQGGEQEGSHVNAEGRSGAINSSDTYEQSSDDVSTQAQELPGSTSARRSQRLSQGAVNQISSHLTEVSSKFRESNRQKDPLLAVLNAPDRVQSVLGITKRKSLTENALQNLKSPNVSTSEEEEHGNNNSTESDSNSRNVKRKSSSISSSRGRAGVVVFSEDEESEDSQRNRKDSMSSPSLKRSLIAEKRAELDIGNRENFQTFPKKLEVNIKSSPSQRGEKLGHDNFNRTKWTSDEEDALLEGVQEYGASCWAKILADPKYNHRFNCRNSVNLKDKYRNLQKKGVVDK